MIQRIAFKGFYNISSGNKDKDVDVNVATQLCDKLNSGGEINSRVICTYKILSNEPCDQFKLYDPTYNGATRTVESVTLVTNDNITTSKVLDHLKNIALKSKIVVIADAAKSIFKRIPADKKNEGNEKSYTINSEKGFNQDKGIAKIIVKVLNQLHNQSLATVNELEDNKVMIQTKNINDLTFMRSLEKVSMYGNKESRNGIENVKLNILGLK